jgi:hypothetical protein
VHEHHAHGRPGLEVELGADAERGAAEPVDRRAELLGARGSEADLGPDLGALLLGRIFGRGGERRRRLRLVFVVVDEAAPALGDDAVHPEQLHADAVLRAAAAWRLAHADRHAHRAERRAVAGQRDVELHQLTQRHRPVEHGREAVDGHVHGRGVVLRLPLGDADRDDGVEAVVAASVRAHIPRCFHRCRRAPE